MALRLRRDATRAVPLGANAATENPIVRPSTVRSRCPEPSERYTALGFANLPICMAKTHLSFTDDPTANGAPEGLRVTVRDMRLSAGAGFIDPLIGAMRTMPGLSPRAAYVDVDLDPETGRIEGLF